MEFIANNKELRKGYDNYYSDEENLYGYPNNEIDLGITAGVGYDFTNNFGIEARVKKGFIPVLNYGDYHSNVVFQLGAYYTFNTKNKVK